MKYDKHDISLESSSNIISDNLYEVKLCSKDLEVVFLLLH